MGRVGLDFAHLSIRHHTLAFERCQAQDGFIGRHPCMLPSAARQTPNPTPARKVRKSQTGRLSHLV
jgi:hypothetical protein